MKKFNYLFMFTLFSLVFFNSALFLSWAAERESYEEKFEKTVELTKEGTVILSNVSGDIEVRTWDKAEVKIDALKVSRASSLSRAKENAERVIIEITKEGNILKIESDYPKTFFKSVNVTVHYHLTIPDEASIKVKSVSGEVRLFEIGGSLRADSVSGEIEVREANKGVECKSVSGDIVVEEVVGDSLLGTVSGDIKVKGIKGSLDFETVSGDVVLSGVSDASILKGKTVSGSILFEGEINPQGRYTLSSHSGDIELHLPPTSAFNLEASTFSGSIESEFEILTLGRIREKGIQGAVNGGGAEVSLKTFSGDISLRKK